MNEELRAQHMAQITDPVAVRCYERLCEACASRVEGISDQDQMLIADIATMEQMKQQLFKATPHNSRAGQRVAFL